MFPDLAFSEIVTDVLPVIEEIISEVIAPVDLESLSPCAKIEALAAKAALEVVETIL